MTARELEIVECLRKGMTNKEISVLLKISDNTVKSQPRTIFQKLGISSRKELK